MEINKWPSDTEFIPEVGDKIQLIYSRVNWSFDFDLNKYFDDGRYLKEDEWTLGKTYTVIRTWFVMDGINTDQVQIMGDRGETIWLYAIHFQKVGNSYRFIME